MKIINKKCSFLVFLFAIGLNLVLLTAEVEPDRQFVDKEVVERVVPKEIEAEYDATWEALFKAKEKSEADKLAAKLATLSEKTTLKSATKKMLVERRIAPDTFYPFPQQLIGYLKSKEVPAHLKKDLDKIFGSKEASTLFMIEQAEQQEWSLKWALNNQLNKQQEANCYMGALAKVMEKKGFESIYSNKWDTNHHIYVHPNFPKYVFKCIPSYQFHEGGRHDGWLNISRIEYAEKIAYHIKNKKPPYKTKFTIPKKWAYFVPGGSRYAGSIIVVAEKMNLSTSYPVYKASEQMIVDTQDVLKTTKYTDFGHNDNVIARAEPYNDVVILDTERRAEDIKSEEYDKIMRNSPLTKLRSRL